MRHIHGLECQIPAIDFYSSITTLQYSYSQPVTKILGNTSKYEHMCLFLLKNTLNKRFTSLVCNSLSCTGNASPFQTTRTRGNRLSIIRIINMLLSTAVRLSHLTPIVMFQRGTFTKDTLFRLFFSFLQLFYLTLRTSFHAQLFCKGTLKYPSQAYSNSLYNSCMKLMLFKRKTIPACSERHLKVTLTQP